MSTRSKRRPGRPSKYPPEFQRDAVAMVLDEGRATAEVAGFGMNKGTLGNWVVRERNARNAGTSLNIDERAELAELRKQNGGLRMERDLLKRSLAFWVKEATT
jgi:transposase